MELCISEKIYNSILDINQIDENIIVFDNSVIKDFLNEAYCHNTIRKVLSIENIEDKMLNVFNMIDEFYLNNKRTNLLNSVFNRLISNTEFDFLLIKKNNINGNTNE